MSRVRRSGGSALQRVLALVLVLGCGRFGFDRLEGHDGGLPADGGDPCVTAGPDAGPSGAIEVSDLSASWSTPSSIRWTWAASGAPEDFAHYELVLGLSHLEVTHSTCSARSVKPAENPELGHFLLPQTLGADPVVATITRNLQPDLEYFALLIAVDSQGRRSVAGPSSMRTAPSPVGEIVVFSDAPTAGFSLPPEFVLSHRNPYAGEAHYEYLSVCQPGCFDNLRRQELHLDTGALSPDDFDRAYVEFALAVEEGDHSYWSQVWLWFEPGGDANRYSFGGWSHRADDTYLLYQFPLRELRSSAGALTPQAVLEGLFGFNVGGAWSEGALVSVDELRIRW